MIGDPYDPIREFIAGECFSGFKTCLGDFVAELSPNHPSYPHLNAIKSIIGNLETATPAPVTQPEEDNSGTEGEETTS